MGTGKLNAGGDPAMDWHPIQGGIEIFLVASCCGNQDKLWPDGPLGSYGGRNVGKTNFGNEELAFLVLVQSRRVEEVEEGDSRCS